MAIKTLSGRGAIAKALLLQSASMYLAWGAGDADWDGEIASYPVTDSMTALVDEIGRRKLTFGCYATPDEDGDLITPSGSFIESIEPTAYLFTRFTFDTTDAPSATLREIGLFVFCEPIAGLPAGQKYFTPAQIDDPGIMISVERFEPITRTPDATQSFGFVLPL